MRRERFTKPYLSTIVLTIVATVMLGAGALAWENPLKGRYLTGAPLSVCDQGSFFVGGVPKITRYASSAAAKEGGAPQQITIGQMYVQFQVPEQRRGIDTGRATNPVNTRIERDEREDKMLGLRCAT